MKLFPQEYTRPVQRVCGHGESDLSSFAARINNLMENEVPLTLDDVEKLENLSRKASATYAAFKSEHAGKPLPEGNELGDWPYPEEVHEMMDFILRSNWRKYDYVTRTTRRILDNLENASLEDIRSAMTHVARSERYCTGSWGGVIERGIIICLVERAGEILEV